MNTRRKTLLATLLGLLTLAFSSAAHPMPRLLWNASASVPVGLYFVRPVAALHPQELLVVRPSAALARLMAARKYLADGVPLIKHVAALPGHVVCRIGALITIDGVAEAGALHRDARGRKLPVWQGCRTVRPSEVFLMNAGAPDSFDGRYFGLTSDQTIVGSATPLWLPSERSFAYFGQ